MKFDLNKNEENIGFISNKMVKSFTSDKMIAFYKKLNIQIEEINKRK